MEWLPASQTTCGVSDHTVNRYRLNTGFKSGSSCPTVSPSRPTWLYGIQGSEGNSHVDLLPAGGHRSYLYNNLFKNYRDLGESENSKKRNSSPQHIEGSSYEEMIKNEFLSTLKSNLPERQESIKELNCIPRLHQFFKTRNFLQSWRIQV